MPTLVRISLLACVVVGIGLALPRPTPAQGQGEQYDEEMTTYQVAILMAGRLREELSQEQALKLDEDHLNYMNQLVEDGRVVTFGSLEEGGPIDGVVILAAESVEQANELLQADPWIQKYNVLTEIHPWWAAKGILQKPKDLKTLSGCWLGLLRRPRRAPEYDEKRLEEIQQGHLQHLNKMADSGDLVIAGPMVYDGSLRGVLVFRTESRNRVMDLVAQDPAVMNGRLELRLYRWNIPAGTIPAR